MTFATALTEARSNAGLTLRQLADAIGMTSRTRLHDYEKGTRTPSAKRAAALAKALGQNEKQWVLLASRYDQPED